MLLEEITAKNNRQRFPNYPRSSHRVYKHVSTFPSRRRRTSSKPRRRYNKPGPKPEEIFYKCHSENMIYSGFENGSSLGSDEVGWFGRVNTLDDVMLCTNTFDLSAFPLTRINSGYEKEAKVVITVTVEGSPGPVRTLVKLGSNVNETIKLVVQKYGQEGRTPRLDKDSPSSFDLHVSCFSLQSLDRSYAIGDVGTRSFYLRKSNIKRCGSNIEEVLTSLTNYSDGEHIQEKYSSAKQSSSLLMALPPFFARKINKLVRRIHKLFILLGCLHSR